ncbi:MAG: hypothetical protein ACRYFU_11525 [Janthinobacterium lividum]
MVPASVELNPSTKPVKNGKLGGAACPVGSEPISEATIRSKLGRDRYSYGIAGMGNGVDVKCCENRAHIKGNSRVTSNNKLTTAGEALGGSTER